MWGIGIVFTIIVFVIILLLVTSKLGKKEEKSEKKVYAMPPQRRYPYFYYKDCVFYADSSSRFDRSEEDLEQLISSLDESFNREDYSKTIKLANELIKLSPKLDKVWLKKINAIFADVMKNENPWKESYSKIILNCCYGFLQCYDNILEKSISAKHILFPVLIKNIEELIKYQSEKVTKYHNFEVYNMLLNMYHVIPFKDNLGLMSNRILEDKTDKDLDSDNYARQTLKNLLAHVDMLRTRHTSRLQETFESKRITNCTIITDDRINATIIAFELNFPEGVTKETIEATFFDENGDEINFGNDEKSKFFDIFLINSDKGATVKEEIVVLSDIHIDKVKLKICADANMEKDDTETSEDSSKNDNKVTNDENNPKPEDKNESEGNNEKNTELEVVNEPEIRDNNFRDAQTLIYPCFDNITDIKVSDYNFAALKNDGTVMALGVSDNLNQVSTWENIAKIYLKDEAIFGVREDGSVIYSGKCEYDKAEYIYSWENVESLAFGEKHMIGITKNSTLYAIGSNTNGECDVEDWYDIADVKLSYHTVGLCKDGKVKAIGENNFGECDVKSWQDIVQIAVGEFYTLGLTSSGKVLSTGLNSCGQCNVTEWANIKKIYASGNMSIGLRYDGKVVTAGKNSYRYDDVKQWNRIKDVVVSNNRIIGIEQDGTVRATGKPYRNFVNEQWNDVMDVAINSNNIIALKENGTVVSNTPVLGYVLADSSNEIVKIVEDFNNTRIAILNNKDVLTIANKVQTGIIDDPYPVLYDIKMFDMSDEYLVAVKNDGTALYVNLNDKVAVNISGWDNVIDVKAGKGFIVGLNINGTVMFMSVGEKNKFDVSEWKDVVKIGAAGTRVMGLTIDGKLLMTGVSEFSEEDFIKILKNVKDFAINASQIMILLSDGTVKITYHPTGVGTESAASWRNVKKVVARGDNFIGLTTDGKVYSTVENEIEIGKWEEVEDIDASNNYVWARLKMPH